ncbi:hypothetical protein [Streptomyces sp. NPDC048637]|uniref:hypothetical protein n=1 Tax=Streptomyces sp. NPDC048637 TaxID=3155636 RepID=UPI00343245E5
MERVAQAALHAVLVVEGRLPGPAIALDVRLLVVVLGGLGALARAVEGLPDLRPVARAGTPPWR